MRKCNFAKLDVEADLPRNDEAHWMVQVQLGFRTEIEKIFYNFYPLGYNSTFQAYALHKWLASSLWKPFVCHYIEPAPIFIYSQKQTCG